MTRQNLNNSRASIKEWVVVVVFFHKKYVCTSQQIPKQKTRKYLKVKLYSTVILLV